MTTKPVLRFVKVPADEHRRGYDHFRLREDLSDSYLQAYSAVHALGGIVTSSGSLRALAAQRTRGRSPLSLHYLGRAFDLFVGSGMSSGDDPYAIRRAGGSDSRPRFEVLCQCSGPMQKKTAFDSDSYFSGEIDALIWRRGVGPGSLKRCGNWLSITRVFRESGWEPICARPGWRSDYSCVEWWHFQNTTGLVAGRTTFAEELARVYPYAAVARSRLKLNAVWRGDAFR